MNPSHPLPPSARGGLAARLLLILGVLVALAACVWVLFLPRIVSSMIQKKTGFVVKVDRLSVNPFTANVQIAGLVMQNPPGWPREDFVEVRELRADTSLFSLFGNRFVADEIVVDVARLTLVRNQQGVLNASAFGDGLSGGPSTGEEKSSGKRSFLIRHLVVRFDQLVVADYSGRQPTTKEYNLNLSRDMHDVDSVTKIVSPILGAALGTVGDALGSLFKSEPDMLKSVTGTLQEAGKKTGEALKGLFDALDKKKP
jgi:hypothetical protein